MTSDPSTPPLSVALHAFMLVAGRHRREGSVGIHLLSESEGQSVGREGWFSTVESFQQKYRKKTCTSCRTPEEKCQPFQSNRSPNDQCFHFILISVLNNVSYNVFLFI